MNDDWYWIFDITPHRHTARCTKCQKLIVVNLPEEYTFERHCKLANFLHRLDGHEQDCWGYVVAPFDP